MSKALSFLQYDIQLKGWPLTSVWCLSPISEYGQAATGRGGEGFQSDGSNIGGACSSVAIHSYLIKQIWSDLHYWKHSLKVISLQFPLKQRRQSHKSFNNSMVGFFCCFIVFIQAVNGKSLQLLQPFVRTWLRSSGWESCQVGSSDFWDLCFWYFTPFSAEEAHSEAQKREDLKHKGEGQPVSLSSVAQISDLDRIKMWCEERLIEPIGYERFFF